MGTPRSLGILGALSGALLLPSRNKKFMFPAMALALIPNSLLLFSSHVSVYPMLVDFIMKLHSLGREYPTTPQFYDLLLCIRNDARAMSRASVALIVASYLASLLSTVIVVHSSSAACSGRPLPAQDLFLKVKGSWTPAMVTMLYSTLLSMGYTVLSVSLITVPLLNMAGPARSVAFVVAVAVAVAVVARFLYIYLAMVWAVGVVVAVVEDGCHGLEALQQAGEVVRGRRTQGFLIALVLLLGDGVVAGGLGFGGSSQKWREVAVRTVYLLLRTFSTMVYTVFYHECKKSQGANEVGELPHTKVDDATSVDMV